MAIHKQLPPQTIPNLIPPKEDYVYFEAARQNPFRADADRFELLNAAWLMDAAMLVYGVERFIHEKVALLAAEVPGVEVQVFAGRSTQAFVLHSPQFVIVAFRGTRVELFPDPIALLQRALPGGDLAGRIQGTLVFLNWRDLVTDVRFGLGPHGIHRGFEQALLQTNVWEAIEPFLDTLSGRPIWFTGHSLGAALATIAAARCHTRRPVRGLYTFGSPRVGNSEFTRTVPPACYRFVNNDDIVTRLPPSVAGYEHVGQTKFINAAGNVVDEAREDAADGLAGRLTGLFGSFAKTIPQVFREGTANPARFIENLRTLDFEVPDNGLTDHAPVNYACRIWNAGAFAQVAGV